MFDLLEELKLFGVSEAQYGLVILLGLPCELLAHRYLCCNMNWFTKNLVLFGSSPN